MWGFKLEGARRGRNEKKKQKALSARRALKGLLAPLTQNSTLSYTRSKTYE